MEQSANHLTVAFGYSVKLSVIQNEHHHLHTILQRLYIHIVLLTYLVNLIPLPGNNVLFLLTNYVIYLHSFADKLLLKF